MHCALACKMEEGELKSAKLEAERIELPLIAKVTEIALAECNPYKEIYVWTIPVFPQWQTELPHR